MPPYLALLVTVALVAWLLWRDMRSRRAGSWLLVIPGVSFLIRGSRPVGYWFGLDGGSSVEGSPVDRTVFLLLIIGAIIILVGRHVNWHGVVMRNKALLLTCCYLLLTVCWAYMPVVSCKRWIKVAGDVMIALAVLAERNPIDAIRILIVRCSYVLLPLSVVTAKYFGDVGRVQSRSWQSMITGLTEHKNALGQMVMVVGLVLVWDVLENSRLRASAAKRVLRLNHSIVCLCAVWLLLSANSQTALVCCVLGVAILLGSRHVHSMRNSGRVILWGLGLAACALTAEAFFGVSEEAVKVLGRDATLTGRVEIWELVRREHVNPLVGCGYYSFWDSQPTSELEAFVESGFRQAHNGYLETYLDGGLVGVGLLVLMLSSVVTRVIRESQQGSLWSCLGLAVVVVTVIYNCLEASFFRGGPLWFTFLLVAIECPVMGSERSVVGSRWAWPEESPRTVR